MVPNEGAGYGDLVHEMPKRPFCVFFDIDGSEPSMPRDEIQRLAEVCSWAVPPPFEENGRSAVLRRDELLFLGDGTIVGAYQFKGVGYRRDGVVCPPNLDRPYVPDLHRINKEVDDDGEFYPSALSSSILGGITQDEAKREFQNLIKLRDAGISVPAPIRVGEMELENGASTGLLVLGHPVAGAIRFGEYLENGNDGGGWLDNPFLKSALLDLYGISEEASIEDKVFYAFCFVADAQLVRGVMLRAVASDANLFGLQPHLGNFTCDHKRGVTMLHDFETLRSLDEVSYKSRGVHLLMDLYRAVSALSHFFPNFDDLDQLSELKVLALTNGNPYIPLLRGYFSREISDPSFESELNSLASELWCSFIDDMDEYRKVPKSGRSDWRNDHRGITSICLPCQLVSLYSKSELGKSYPLPYRAKELYPRLMKAHEASAELFERVQKPLIEDAEIQEAVDGVRAKVGDLSTNVIAQVVDLLKKIFY